MTRERITTYGLFCLPGFIAYCVFLIFPILMGIYYSFMDWNGISKSYNFIGFANYAKLLTDKKFGEALLFNFRYSIMLIVGVVVISVVLALLLNKEFKGRSFFRTLYFLPAVLSMITVSLVFKQVFFYVLPAIGKALGIEALSTNILASKQNAIYGVLFVHLWQGVALPTLLVLAGLQTIPTELYEAAAIDGANGWQQFKHIILPGIKTILVLNVILSITGSLSAFEGPYVITSGANGTATYFVRMDRLAHTSQKVGLASAMAIVLLIIILICALLQNLFFKYVFKDADDGVEKARKQAAKIERQRARMARKNASVFKNGPSNKEKAVA